MKKSIGLLLTTTLLGVVTTTPMKVFAQENSNSFGVEQKVSENDFKYYENSPYFNVEKDSTNTETIITISDTDLITLLKENGIDASKINLSKLRANGTTKIVWHGAARNGNIDVYLSKNMLNGMLNIGVGGIAAVIATLFPGVGTAVGGVVAGQVASHELFNNGVIYKIRGFRLSTIVYQ